MDKSKQYKTTGRDLVTVPAPLQTKTYKPITHKQLIELTEQSVIQAGFTVQQSIYTAARAGQVATARYLIGGVGDKEMQLMIGWQNSYDRSVTLKFAIGAHVFICQNGVVSGDMGAFKRKHITDVQEFTPLAITEYIKAASGVFLKTQEQREMMKQVEVTRTRAAELIGRLLVEERVINPTQMNILVRELNKPSFDYGAPSSLWELYQLTTYAMRDTHPEYWVSDHLKVHDFFVQEHGNLTVITTSSIVKPDPQMSIFDVIDGEAVIMDEQNDIQEENIEKVMEQAGVLDHEEPEEFVQALEEASFQAISRPGGPEIENVEVDPDANYLVRIGSVDDEDYEKEYQIKVRAEDEDDADRVARNVFEFDFPLKPVFYSTINRIK